MKLFSPIWQRFFTLVFYGLGLLTFSATPLGHNSPTLVAEARQSTTPVALAYVHNNTVKLADAAGNLIATTGPEFQSGQGATLFWSADGESLYIARRDGMYVTGANGGAATRLPGNYGLTVIFDRTGNVLYYLESTSPAEGSQPDRVTFPLRELNTTVQIGGTGRLVTYIGDYASGTAQAELTTAALQYARDGGLLGNGRPRLFTTYGTTLFYSCCFPDPGINALNLITGDKTPYDLAVVPGAASINNSFSRLAAPTVDGNLRLIDLISGGTRDYPIGLGEIERTSWSPDDKQVYFAVRAPAQEPLQLTPLVTAPVDTRSASIQIWRLDLVTGQTRQLATLGDFYGVSSMATTSDYIFVVAVERNQKLVNDLIAGRLPSDLPANDARLGDYLPGTILFRISPDGSEALSILSDVWGLVARPIR